MAAKRRPSPPIGGPGTRLPRAVESLLSWTLAVSCLGVSGYHYVLTTSVLPALACVRLRIGRALFREGGGGGQQQQQQQQQQQPPPPPPPPLLPFDRCWVPLTTHSRAELDRATPRERLRQLGALLAGPARDGTGSAGDEELIRACREDGTCRRLASLAMRPHPAGVGPRAEVAEGTVPPAPPGTPHPDHDLARRLARLWPRLLVLPPLRDAYQYGISLVLPAFGEDGGELARKLGQARAACRHPDRVQVIVVDAGGCANLDVAREEQGDGWGQFRIRPFPSGGGRGPCLNFGAAAATGRLLTFCHSDTQLSDAWDVRVEAAFATDSGGGSARSSSCAFAFGIDTTPAGLGGGPCPPGIRAVEATANLRTHLYSLPYGDQCISVPADVFRFVGGFPDQCLMEDYELVALLRRRSALLPRLGIAEREELTILGGQPALCSPRRWQKSGVLYVTWMNSKFVNLYAGGMGPDALFRLYYKASPPRRDSDLSPWEIEAQLALESKLR